MALLLEKDGAFIVIRIMLDIELELFKLRIEDRTLPNWIIRHWNNLNSVEQASFCHQFNTISETLIDKIYFENALKWILKWEIDQPLIYQLYCFILMDYDTHFEEVYLPEYLSQLHQHYAKQAVQEFQETFQADSFLSSQTDNID